MARYRKEDDNNSLIIVVAMGKRLVVDEYGDYHRIDDDFGNPQYTAKTDTPYGCVECDHGLRHMTRSLYDDIKSGCAFNGKKVMIR